MPSKSYKKEFTAKDGTKFILREPKSTDAKLCMDEINQFVDEPYSGILINKKLKLNEERDWLKGTMAGIAKKTKVYLIVEINKKIMGGCSVERKRWKQDFIGFLGIALLKEIRRKGIGSVLIKETIKLTKQRMNGLEVIDLTVLKYNKRAQKFYKKMGFKKFGEIKKVIKEGKEYVDESYLRYKL